MSTPKRVATHEYYLGIDFGTRFSKIAIWSEGSERRIWEDRKQGNLIPSIVYVLPSGTVLHHTDTVPPEAVKVEYLKMIIVGDKAGIFTTVHPSVAGRDIREFAQPLAAAFLAEIIRKVKRAEEKNLQGSQIRWLVNLGMPVQYCDAPESKIFHKLGAIAFEWSKHPREAETLESLRADYLKTEREIDPDHSPVTVVPELTAALHDFFRDPNRAEGLYGFCDVGGGTLDAAIFRVNRFRGISPLGIPSARVEQLGTMALSEGLSRDLGIPPDGLEQLFVQPVSASILARPKVHAYKESVQNFLRVVVNDARWKETGHTFYEGGDGSKPKKELQMFMAGGGAHSGWYQSALKETDGPAFDGLSRARPILVPKPARFRGADFPRFVVALGLADAPDNFGNAVLPKAIPRKADFPPRQITLPIYEKK
jgi:hypothetical protein